MPRLIYSLLLTLLLPFIVFRLWYKAKANPAYRLRVRERFGQYDLDSKSKRIWIHAVSVGEVNAAVPLVNEIQKTWPNYKILITTMTPTGADQVRRCFTERVDHRYVPYDQPWLVNRALNQASPTILIIMETEIWPNLICASRKRNIPVLLMNMRLSFKSFTGYKKIRWFVQPALSKVNVIAAQTSVDAQRVEALGALPKNIRVLGNIKYDAGLADSVLSNGKAIRAQLGDSRMIWIAASTHSGEDEKVLKAHDQILKVFPKALLIIAPRHPERFDHVFNLSQAQYNTLRRTGHPRTLAESQVYVVDTMGELLDFYAASDISFVAGSLVPVGGHNVLEPWLLGKPVIVGPHMFNFLQIAAQGLERDAMIQVADSKELAQAVISLVQSPARCLKLSDNAYTLLEENKGALAESINLLKPYLD